MAEINHTIEKWVDNVAKGLTPLEYYNTKFKYNTHGINPSLSLIKKWNLQDDADLNKLLISFSQTFIMTIIDRYRHLNELPFNETGLTAKTRTDLIDAVFKAVHDASYNNTWIERKNSSSISTPSFNYSSNATGWVMVGDPVSFVSWKIVENSGLLETVIVNNAQELYELKQNGMIRILSYSKMEDEEYLKEIGIPETVY